VSESKRDRQRDYDEKRLEYMEAGVREYWVIDRFKRIMTFYHHNEKEQVIPESDIYGTDLLPGFELPLAKVLAIADDWQAGTG
jgi:Uma2 family endonuclease